MNNRHEQFLNLYQTYRHKDQAAFYKARVNEFEASRRQIITFASMLMVLTAIVSILVATDLFGLNKLWATLVVLFPALSTAVSSYASLFGFEKQAKLYKEALYGLRRGEVSLYNAQHASDDAERRAKIEAYVNQIEEIFRKEQGQWKQEISETNSVEPPKSNE
ncbi:MAG: SLATT domain-containing protein [Blastocatellales bacterium]